MLVLERLTNYISHELQLNDTQTSTIFYALQMIHSTMSGLFFVVIAGWAAGVLSLSLTAVLASASLRLTSGGAHSARVLNCSLLGALLSTGIAIISKHLSSISALYLLLFILTIVIITLFSIWKYAPADTPNKPITNPVQIKKLRLLSFVQIFVSMVVFMFIFYSFGSVSAPYTIAFFLAYLWQAFSMSPSGYRFVSMFDKFIPSF